MMFTRLTFFLALSAASPLAAATPSHVVFDVKGMTCSTCPITVRALLKKLPGVEEAKVDAEKHTAAVRFDSGKVSADRIAQALTEAGFPAAPRK
jgi:mercuric ion binding protein